MKELSLRLMTRNRDLLARWQRWLTAQGWSVVALPAESVLGRLPGGGRGPVLLDAALLEAKDEPAVRGLSSPDVPVILFGDGAAASNDSVARWLQAGADDFIPASMPEKLLVAKLQAFARRILPEMDKTVLFSRRRDVKADPKSGLAWTKEQGRWQAVPALTETELRLLCLFLANPGEVLERDRMMDEIWRERSADVFSANLTQHVMSLRRKLGRHGEAIRTAYGRGYMFLEEK